LYIPRNAGIILPNYTATHFRAVISYGVSDWNRSWRKVDWWILVLVALNLCNLAITGWLLLKSSPITGHELMNMVMNLQVSYKVQNFLFSWMSIRFSTITLLHGVSSIMGTLKALLCHLWWPQLQTIKPICHRKVIHWTSWIHH
jgi:ascorbate-specific PTS system EIIC-type component UlaA